MAEPPPEDRKVDLSKFPRGAIGLRGLPVNRNARLPSIRSPRDLTLGTQPKRTFVVNIPPRRTSVPTKAPVATAEVLGKNVRNSKRNDRNRGRARTQVVQMQGSVFGEGIAAPSQQKERNYESYQKSSTSTATASRPRTLKQEKVESDMSEVDYMLDKLFRDDFIDDGDDVKPQINPITFPPPACFKSEKKTTVKKEPVPIDAKENFDFEAIAKTIKKEKDIFEDRDIKEEIDEKEHLSDLFEKGYSESSTKPTLAKGTVIYEPQLMLFQFPECITFPQKTDVCDRESSKRHFNSTHENTAQDQNPKGTSISNLSEGYIGKLQLLKSGKTRLVLGSLILDVEPAMPFTTQHDVASVRLNVDGGDMTILGHVQQKVKCMPSICDLLSQQSVL